MHGDEDAVEKARELETGLVQQRLSSITLIELYSGIVRATDADDVSTVA
jgi:tRNA(fMet)-specific endonuclease VapC